MSKVISESHNLPQGKGLLVSSLNDVLTVENGVGDWMRIFHKISSNDYFQPLDARIVDAYQSGLCHPRPELIFRALRLCQYSDVKVVILGQDPYHGFDQADGLAFSVP